MPTDSSLIVPCADSTFVDFHAGATGERYTRSTDGTFTTEALPVGKGLEDYDLRDDFDWTPITDFTPSSTSNGTAGSGSAVVSGASTAVPDTTSAGAAQSTTRQADVWHYSDDYISVDLPASWQGYVYLDASGHTSGAYHVDGSMAAMGAESSIIRFDGMKGDSNISVSFCDGCGRVIWNAIRNGTYDGLRTADAADVLARLTNGAVPPDDALSKDEDAFATEVKDAMQAYAWPMVSSSLAPS